MTVTVINADVLTALRDLPSDHFGVVVTSPPYWRLRSYDETAFRIDPNLPPEKLAWLISELERRGIHARR